MSAALLAYRYPGLSQFVLDHVLTEGVSLPDEPRRGRHAAPKRHRGRRWPGWLRPRKRDGASAPWWWHPGDPGTLRALKPITGPTLVTIPRSRGLVPVARTAGCPPWERTREVTS